MIEPEEICKFAASLLQDSPNELLGRQAASRAFYSVLLLIREDLKIVVPQVRNTHEYIREELFQAITKNSPPRHLQLAANFFGSLRDSRKVADYEINRAFEVSRGKRMVAFAEQVFEAYKQAHATA